MSRGTLLRFSTSAVIAAREDCARGARRAPTGGRSRMGADAASEKTRGISGLLRVGGAVEGMAHALQPRSSMNRPQITFRNMDPSDTIVYIVQKKAEKLGHFFDKIMSCHVIIEAPHRRHTKGTLYHVRIEIAVPGEEIVVNHDGHDNHAYEDAFVAVSDAFDAATRKLLAHVHRRRSPEPRAHAKAAL